MTGPVICVGCTFWDTICAVDALPKGGGKLLPGQVVQNASGMTTVAATAVARLGGPVRLWTRIGDDETGRALLADLAREGIPTDGVRRIPGGRTWFSTILVEAGGERLVIAALSPLDPDPSGLPLGEVAGAGAVLSDMRWPEAARLAFAEADRHGIPTILDADVAPLPDLRALVPLAGHVLFSEPAFASYAGAPPEPGTLGRVAAELPSASVVGVTLGPRGALLAERRGREVVLHDVPTLAIDAVDTLNAGDVWHGTYAYGLAAGWDLTRRARAANVAAAIKCERFGGKVGTPHLAELEMRLRQAGW